MIVSFVKITCNETALSCIVLQELGLREQEPGTLSSFCFEYTCVDIVLTLGCCFFRVRSSDSIGEEVYTEMLLKNTTPYITTQVVASSLL